MPPVTSITFTDGIGAATLTNGKPYPANRFSNWNPFSMPYGDRVTRQSDRTPTMFRLGSLYGASFELRMIPQRTSGGVRLVTIADRLRYHLLNGGSCTVNTGDTDTAIYTGCYVAPGVDPQLSMADPNQLEHTLTLSLINPAGTRMVCHYDA